MANSSVGYIIILLVVLAVVIILFAFVDRLIKGSGPAKKKVEEKQLAPKEMPSEKIVQENKVETKSPVDMKIYNSELADDLNEIIKNTQRNETSRLQIEKHTDRTGNISKYIRDKNYQSFSFGTEDNTTAGDDEPMTFTQADYKRIVALSNINDKKPL